MNESAHALRAAIEDVLYDADLSNLNGDTHLKDLGANSMDRVDIIIQSMNTLGIKCNLMEFEDARSFEEITTVLQQQRA